MRLLFVCTGNICRSPLAEHLTRTWAREALGAWASRVRVDSAGTDALDGHAMEPHSALALAELGGDATGFSSRAVVPGEAENADLVLTMTRRQRHQVLKQAPRALRRAFTLPEAAALAALTDLGGIAELPLEDRARELARRLNAARVARPADPDDDVLDPIGHPQAVHSGVAAQIASCLRPLAGVLLGPATYGHPLDTRPRPWLTTAPV